jgi:AraC-like DNA-binding protein
MYPPPLSALALAAPPYTHPIPLTREARLPRAAVLVLDVRGPDDAEPRLAQAVMAARTRFPSAPVVVRVAPASPVALRVAQSASRLRVRAVLGTDEPLAPALRSLLAHPPALGDDVVEWMGVRGDPLSPSAATLVRHLVDTSAGCARVADALARAGQSDRTARHCMRMRALPPPSAWHQAARALHAVMRIQAEPHARVLQVAAEYGYSDHSGLSRQLARTFGVGVSAVRGTVGWEWLLDRWLRIRARRRPSRDASGKIHPDQALSYNG